MTTSFWVILHSIIWNGEIKKDDDLPFPFNQIARILKGDEIASIDLKEPVKDTKYRAIILCDQGNRLLEQRFKKFNVAKVFEKSQFLFFLLNFTKNFSIIPVRILFAKAIGSPIITYLRSMSLFD